METATQEQIESGHIEEEAAAVWGRTSLHRLAPEVAIVRQEHIWALTWDRLREATLTSPVCVELSKFLQTEVPDNIEG